VTIVGKRWLLLCSDKIVVHGNDVPERCIHRVKLWLLALIGKTIRQHAFGDSAGPLKQDVARFLEVTGCDAETAQRDKRVASPIAEPRVASN
jgi:hypothetical protein